MKGNVKEIQQIVIDFSTRLHSLDEIEFAAKPDPTRWSKKEIVGHLIDSAQNNLRRFICAQYESTPPKITYQQNFWVSANQYQNTPSKDLIDLWRLINGQICAALTAMPPDKYSALCETDELRTLEWSAIDYLRHMKHHLHQVFPDS